MTTEKQHSTVGLQEMTQRVYDNNLAHGWFEQDRRFGEDIALLHSEVSEALEAYRDHGLEDFTATGCLRCTESGVGACDDAPHTFKPEGVGSELADVLIRLLDTAHRNGIDLEWEFNRKMDFNETRPVRHGGKRL